jgi:hypothetical protein
LLKSTNECRHLDILHSGHWMEVFNFKKNYHFLSKSVSASDQLFQSHIAHKAKSFANHKLFKKMCIMGKMKQKVTKFV